MKKSNTLKFSESGVRGIVGEGLTARLAAELGAAFGFYQGGGRIVVGRDTRPTGAMFEQAVTAGLLAAGCEVLSVGIVPTPTLQYTVKKHEAAGGIAITASHNPFEWNALKFISKTGTFLSQGEASGLFDLYNQGNLPYRSESDFREVRQLNNVFSAHESRIFEMIDANAIKKRKFKVAIDCVNGVGALYSVDFLKKLGCEVFAINDTPDGCFTRPPEPLPENLNELCRVVREKNCDIGFGQDPDGDRLTIVTNSGQALSPHHTVALAIEQVLDGGDPGPVVANIQTSRLIEYIAESYGCKFYTSAVGEINVVEKMVEVDSEIGGEGNCGGVIYRRIHPGRDSFGAMALILERLALSDRKLSDIVANFPPTANLSCRFELSPIRSRMVLRELLRRYSDRSPLTFDGLRFDLPQGRILMRSSNTEPLLRLNVECADLNSAEQLLTRFQSEIQQIIESNSKA
ncbi:MAG: phosphoglucosamine mutase [Victivallales bacterium]|jgi:phosphomannomutase|nr:phosphoglucosamine mutase [Victivallales bacterium]